MQRFTIGLLLVVFFGGGGPAAQGQKEDSATRMKQEVARRERGLHAAAAVTGTYVGMVEAREFSEPVSLDDLVQISDAVIVGRVTGNSSRITADEREINMHYTVAVEELFKGDGKLKSTVIVVPGGRVSFADGSWAQLSVPDLVRPVNGARYLWFLRHADSAGAVEDRRTDFFALAHGGLGLYRLDLDAPIRTSGRGRTGFARWIAISRFTVAAWLEEVRQSARKREPQ